MTHDFLFGTKPLPYFKLPDAAGRKSTVGIFASVARW
jgi:hypothetical protein